MKFQLRVVAGFFQNPAPGRGDNPVLAIVFPEGRSLEGIGKKLQDRLREVYDGGESLVAVGLGAGAESLARLDPELAGPGFVISRPQGWNSDDENEYRSWVEAALTA